jgi:c-di-GMP-binding flagellar brake protein YcgR
MSWDGKEKRAKKRYGIKSSTLKYRKGGLLAFLKPPSPRYLLLNVSETGAHFITKEALAVGQQLRLSMEAPQIRGGITAACAIVWIRKSEDINAFRVGVKFDGLGDRSRRKLKVVLDSAILENVEISTKVYLKEIERL